MKYYFASDIHLGLPPYEDSRKREKRFVDWLDSIKNDAAEIFLLGDIFDFWVEYKKVVPKGFVRALGKIAELTDSGIPVHFFMGNHDFWVGDYLSSEVGMIIHSNSYSVNLCGYNFFMAHGDGLNTDDKKHMFLRYIFRNRFLQRLFVTFHPYIGMSIAHSWSASSRKKHKELELDLNNPFYKYSCKIANQNNIDFLLVGHLHLPVNIFKNGFNFTILPDWFSRWGYAVFDGKDMKLCEFEY